MVDARKQAASALTRDLGRAVDRGVDVGVDVGLDGAVDGALTTPTARDPREVRGERNASERNALDLEPESGLGLEL